MTMKVEVWAEMTCPWCGLGSHRLRQALGRFEHAEDVEVVRRSFPLGSDFPEGVTFSVPDALRRRYGMDRAQVEATTRQVEQLAQAEGLSPYRVLDNQVGNTDLAHEFLAHASAQGKNHAAWETMFDAYFGRARPVFTVDDLLPLAGELDLDPQEIRRVLGDRRYARQVQDEAARAMRLGATGAPFILVEDMYAISGAQDGDALLGVLRQAWHRSHPVTPGADAPACGPEGRAVPARH